jgi:hypothetical protein
MNLEQMEKMQQFDRLKRRSEARNPAAEKYMKDRQLYVPSKPQYVKPSRFRVVSDPQVPAAQRAKVVIPDVKNAVKPPQTDVDNKLKNIFDRLAVLESAKPAGKVDLTINGRPKFGGERRHSTSTAVSRLAESGQVVLAGYDSGITTSAVEWDYGSISAGGVIGFYTEHEEADTTYHYGKYRISGAAIVVPDTGNMEFDEETGEPQWAESGNTVDLEMYTGVDRDTGSLICEDKEELWLWKFSQYSNEWEWMAWGCTQLTVDYIVAFQKNNGDYSDTEAFCTTEQNITIGIMNNMINMPIYVIESRILIERLD